VTQGGAPAVIVAQPAQLKPGYGRVETIAAVPASSGAGSSSSSDMRRLGVRMEDGSFQYVDTPAAEIKIGDRVQFTPEGYIRHPAP
jgi:plastocyanin